MEGTRHRRDKGVELEHQLAVRVVSPGSPARGGLVEVIGAQPCRARAKRHEASALGEPAPSGEAQSPSEVQAYGRRDGCEVCWCLPREICRVPRRR